MRWIKASEGGFSLEKRYHLKLDDQSDVPRIGNFFRNSGGSLFLNVEHHDNDFLIKESDFDKVGYLDESSTITVAPSVSEQGGIEVAADEYIRLQGSHDRPDITKHDFKQGYIAGANSVRQQGDVGYLVDALRDIDLEADFVDPPSTVKRCGEIARKALTKYYETQKQQS